MIRIFALVAVISTVAGAIYWQGGRDTRQKARETTLERSKDISDAIKDSDAAPSWRDQLLGRE